MEYVKSTTVRKASANEFLRKVGSSEVKEGTKLVDLLLRPEIKLNDLIEHFDGLHELTDKITNRKEEIIEAAEILVKYDGYIKREKSLAEKLHRLENIRFLFVYRT